ncbi:MAG: pentapeptide repeat-containing protein [Nitrospinae bacterium]|nr:pentapeptide repeat-containing protein [Nitrospinota bacterium]
MVLLFAAHPPSEHENPKSIRPYGDSINYKELIGTVFGAHNFLDIGPCKVWRIGCRYLDLLNFETKKDEKLSLAGRTLRFAMFTSAHLQGADFTGAQLQGTNFSQAQLQEADFSRAVLKGADFRNSRLQRANFQVV